MEKPILILLKQETLSGNGTGREYPPNQLARGDIALGTFL